MTPLFSAPWPFLFMILGLVKGGYRGGEVE